MEATLNVLSALHPTPLSQLKEVQPLGLVAEAMEDQALLAGLVAAVLQLQSMDHVDRPMGEYFLVHQQVVFVIQEPFLD